ncbi:uncharacterized protein BX664DRAFT_333040 [Halteromyces radiatus]|uniref:uncharacterized protein n=1 Tax=Halteromyces radiatus TaxID=101107 RepID=UPI002220322A|nr:uncharacterized protein BX664DRAFT_333040 [Halteromyces radiatus]KAI8089445.1 hypothetical protein BX664DRAFT_333040 [Halteromyces radiatus]
MTTVLRRVIQSPFGLFHSSSHSYLVNGYLSRTTTTTGWLIQGRRYGHGGVIDPHRLKASKGGRRVASNKLLQSIRKGDQQAVWTQYLALHDGQQLKHLLPEYHSMSLRALGLQHVIAYGPKEIQAIKERLMMIWANMKHCGHTPDIRDYNHMLGFAGRASDWTLCERIWIELMDKSTNKSSLWGLKPNVYSYNAYMMAAIQCKQSEKVASIFNMMYQSGIQPNTFSYNTLMDAYGHLGDVAEVDRIFDRIFVRQQLQQQHKTFSSLLHPKREQSTILGRQVASLTRHAPINNNNNRKNLTPTVDTFMSLIDAHGRHGNTMGLEMIYNKMMPEFKIEPTLAIYNSLIRWYCNKSDLETAKQLMLEMEQRGIQPNVVTFNYMFRHEALKRNRPGVAERLLDFMHQVYQLQPLQSMYRQLIRIHNRHNRDQEVERLVRTYEQSISSTKSK